MADFDCDQRINRKTLRACYEAHPSVSEFQFCVKRWLKRQDDRAVGIPGPNKPAKKRGVMDRLRGSA